MLQVANIEDVFKEYFKVAIIPDRIIELGTMTGRFSIIVYNLRKAINDDFDFITIDIIRDIKIDPLPPNMIYCQMNLFCNLEFLCQQIKPKTLILCDNGNKILEVVSIAPFLKKNCVIMAHDFWYDRPSFNQKGIWGHCEITMEDIAETVECCNLKPYHQDIMINGAWMSLSNIK